MKKAHGFRTSDKKDYETYKLAIYKNSQNSMHRLACSAEDRIVLVKCVRLALAVASRYRAVGAFLREVSRPETAMPRKNSGTL